jgi:putative flippase GtrA
MDPVVGYYISGIVGVLLLFGVYYLLYKLLKREKTDS